MAADKIFICYRRDDSAGHAGRIYDRLNQRFPGRVFMDVAGIGIGTRWAEVIETTLRSCGVIVILIGKRWLERNAAGTRRIDNDNDSTRAEISTALRLNTRVVPLLVTGGVMPDVTDLPKEISALGDWQALRVDDDDFDHDVTRLIRALEEELGDKQSDPREKTAAIKAAELRKLMTEAESAISHREWITARQTLKAVLSLDKNYPEAEERLQFVQESAQARAAPPPPLAPPLAVAAKSRTGLWAGIGGGVLALVIIGAVTAQRESTGSSGLDTPAPVEPGTTPESEPASQPTETKEPAAQPVVRPQAPPTHQQADEEREEPPRAAAPSLAGNYVLASFTVQGNPVPATGAMQLVQLHEGSFEFHTVAMDPNSGARFEYHGMFQRVGNYWTVTTTQTNDPTVVGGPIVNQVQFDGTTLALQNAFGQSYIWRKQ